MGSLSNLYVSQSYQSLLHLGSDSSFFPVGASPTSGYVTVQDGLGYNAGFAISSSGDMFFSQSVIVDKNLSVNQNLDVDGNLIISGTFDIEGKVTLNDNVRINGNLEVSGATTLTGSLVVSNAITASNMFLSNDLIVSGTLFASKVVTLIESSSIIFSSGSNILGDSTSDIQTLNGTTIMSGSSSLTGSMGITGNLNVKGEISSSTINGIGNVTTYSASVQSYINTVSSSISGTINTLSQSLDSRLDFLEGPFSSSVSSQIISLQNFTGSQGLVTTASFNSYTQSVNNSIANLNTTTASLNTSITNLNIATGSLNSKTGSYATTGSNTFIGNEIFSGSVRGQVITLNVASQTASIDCSIGNFFTLTLISESVTRLVATNINPGQTISLKILQSQPTIGNISYPANIKFPEGLAYTASLITSSTDILTFVSYDSTDLYGTVVENFK